MEYLRRAREFLSEHGRTIERAYMGGVCVPLGIYWDGYFLSETIKIGQDFLYSSNAREAVNHGIELMMGGTMTGLVALCVIGAALIAKRGPVHREEQLQEQNP
ncbi:hypothetical protein KY335_05300 [Candidatus Woesearchaeota archaeon]|nr:hypothetical protein [Candidatus Woesearchaeota archaeon]